MLERMTPARAQALCEEHDVKLHSDSTYFDLQRRSVCALGLYAVQRAGGLEAGREMIRNTDSTVVEMLTDDPEHQLYLRHLEDSYENFYERDRTCDTSPAAVMGHEDGTALRALCKPSPQPSARAPFAHVDWMTTSFSVRELAID